MSEVGGFLADILPRLREAEIALHSGDAGPRSALWSHDDPVTLFGGEVNRIGWSELSPPSTGSPPALPNAPRWSTNSSPPEPVATRLPRRH